MAYEVVMPYHLHMPSYFLETFTEYPYIVAFLFFMSVRFIGLMHNLQQVTMKLDLRSLQFE